MRRRGALTLALGSALLVWGCDENLPVGPELFRGVTLQVVGWADTLVIGDTRDPKALTECRMELGAGKPAAPLKARVVVEGNTQTGTSVRFLSECFLVEP